MDAKLSDINGCFLIDPVIREDARGRFVKTFQTDKFIQLGLAINFVERYYSVSSRNVLRGLHFQTPPYDHEKIVYCVSGNILDVVVDLRVGSPSYGAVQTFRLTGEKSSMVYVPSGVAHGFYTKSDVAIVMYEVTSEHSPEHDLGLRWNSIGFQWPCEDPIMSERDKNLPLLSDFISPFIYN